MKTAKLARFRGRRTTSKKNEATPELSGFPNAVANPNLGAVAEWNAPFPTVQAKSQANSQLATDKDKANCGHTRNTDVRSILAAIAAD
jgi:hypothetical protein